MDKQVRNYLKILETTPENVPAFRALEKIFTEQEQWQELVNLYQQRADAVASQAPKLLLKAAEIYKDKLGSVEDMERMLNLVLEKDPENSEALEILRKHYEETGQIRKLRKLLESRLETIEDPNARADVAVQLAELCLHDEDIDGALEHLVAVLADAPEHVEALKTLRKVYLIKQDWDNALDVLEKEIAADSKSAADAILATARALSDDPFEMERAKELFERALKLTKGKKKKAAIKEEIAKLESLKDRWEDEVSALMEKAMKAEDKRSASNLYFKVAALLYLYNRSDAEGIVDAITNSLLLYSGNKRALLLAEKFFTESGEQDKLLEFYESVAGRTRDEKLKAYCLAGAAAILEEKGDADKALELYEQAFELDPLHEEAFEAVRRILESKEMWVELSKRYEKRIELAKDKKVKVKNLVGLARIMEEHLDSPITARDYYTEAIELDPTCIEAAKALVGAYIEEEDFDRAAPVLKLLMEHEPDDKQRASYALEYARIAMDKLYEYSEAFDAAALALSLDPANEDALSLLYDSAAEADRFEDAVDVLQKVIEALQQSDDAESVADTVRRLKLATARILDRELSDYEKAERLYLDLLEENPSDIEILRLLSKLYIKDQQWEKLVDIYGKLIEVTDNEDEKRSVLLERAQTIEFELDDKARAAEAYEAVVESFPEEIEAYKRLEELYEDLQEWEKLANAITKELEVITSIPERINLYYRLGEILEQKLGRVDDAILAYSEVLKLDDSHLPSIEVLERLLQEGKETNTIFSALEPYYLHKKEYDKLAAGYRSLLDEVETTAERVELYKKLADLHSKYLDEKEIAFRWLEQALMNAPEEVEILPRIREIAKDLGRSTDLVQMLSERMESIEDYRIKAKYALVIAQIYMDEINAPDKAEDALLSAAQHSPEDVEVLRTVVDFYRFAESWVQYSGFAERLLHLLENLSEQIELAMELAEVYHDRLERLDAAVETLEFVLNIDPKHEDARRLLRKYYREQEDWDKLIELLGRELNIVKSDEEIIDIKLELAQIYEDILQDFEKTADLYGEVLSLDSRQQKAIEGLERLMETEFAKRKAAEYLVPVYERHKEFEKLVRALAVLFASTDEPDKKREYADKISNITLIELGNKSDAFLWALKAYLYTAGVEPGSNVETLAIETGDWESYLATLEEKKRSTDEISRLETLVLKQAQIADEQLGDPVRALGYLDELLGSEKPPIAIIEAAERLYEKLEDFEALYSLWERKLEIIEERSAKRALRIQMADIRRSKLGDLSGAREILEQLFEERDNDTEVINRLAEVYEEQEDFEALLNLYKHKLSLLRDEVDIVPMRIQIGELYEYKLGNLDEAMNIYLQVIRNNYENEHVQNLIERLLEQENTQLAVADEIELKLQKTKEWNRLVRVYEIQLKHETDPDKKRKLLSRLSSVYNERLKDPVKAFEGFTRVFIEDPRNNEVLFELEKLASELGYWKELAEVYENGADALGEDHESARALLLKAAQLYEEILAQQDDAIRAYRKVLNHDPTNLTAIRALEVLCRKAELWPELVDIYLQRVELAEDPQEKRELYWAICEIYENPDQLNDRLGALPYYEALLELDDTDEQVQLTLLQMYAETENWEKTAYVLRKQVEQAIDDEQRIDVMLKLAILYEERMNDPQEAIHWYRSIIEIKEDHEQAFEALQKYLEREEFQQELAPFMAPIYKRRENWDRYIDALEYQLKFTEGREAKADMLITIAQTYEHKLSDETMAYIAYTRAFREVPGHEYIQNELERLAGRLGRFEELLGLYEEEIEKIRTFEEEIDNRDALLVNLHMQAAKLYEEYLQDLSKATEHLRALTAIDPHNREALNRLERIYSITQQWQELIEVLRMKLEIAEDIEEKKNVYFRICNIYEDELGQNQDAISVYREMLELDSSDRDVLHALERLCRAEQMWDDLIGVLEHEFSIVSAPEDQRHILNQIAQVKWMQLGQVAEAQDIIKGIVAEEPDNYEARELLEQMLQESESQLGAAQILAPIFEAEQDWNRLIDMLIIQEKFAEDADLKRQLNERIARIYEENLSDESSSFDFWCAALSANPEDDILALHLDDLALSLDRWRTLADHYREVLETLQDEDLLFKYRVRIGRIYLDRLNEPDEAEPFFRAALDQRPEDMELLNVLENIYEELERWEDVVEMLYRKAELTEALDEKLPLYFRAARIQEDNTGNVDAAIFTYNTILQHDPDNMRALIELDRLYSETENWERLEEVIAKLSTLTEDDALRHDLIFRRGNLWRDRLGNTARAIELYADIIAEDKQYSDALEALTELVSDPEHQEQALGVLVPAYEELDWWDKIADLYERKLATVTDKDARVELLNQIKEIHELRLEDKEAAFAVARRLYVEDFDNPISMAELERLAIDTGGYEGLVDTYLEIADQIPDQDQRIEVLEHVASICEEQLGDNQRAIEQLRKVLELEPGRLSTANNLDRLYEKEGMWIELAELIPKKLAMIEDRKKMLEEKLRLASIWESKLADNETAIEIYEEILAEKPDNIEALHALQRLYEAEGRWDQLVQVLRAEVRIARGDRKKAALYARMADVLYEKLDRVKEALNLYNRVLQFDEENREVIEKLESLYESLELWDQLVVHLQKQLRRARAVEDKVRFNKKLAEVYRQHLNMEDKAVSIYHKILELAPEDMETVGILEDIYISNQAWSKLAALLNQLLGRVDESKRKSINVRLASLYFQYIKDEQKAVEYARKVLDANPDYEDLNMLEEIFRDSLHKDVYKDIITRQIELAEDVQQKIFLLFRLADLSLEENDKQAAIGYYERVLDIEPNHLLAAEALESLYKEAEMWQPLVRVYEVMLNEYTEGEERLAVQEKLARLYEERLEDFASAFDVYASILHENPERYELISHCEDLARKSEKIHHLVRLYRDIYPAMPDKSRQRMLCSKIAYIYEQELNNPDLAAEYYKIYLEFGEYDDHAAEFLINYHRAHEEWEELILGLEFKLPHVDAQQKIEILHEIGRIYSSNLQDISEAIKTYRRAYEYDDTNLETIDSLIELYRKVEDYEGLVDMLKQKLHVIEDKDLQQELRLEIARTYEEKLNDIKNAKVYFRAIMAENPTHKESLDALERIYTEEENYDEMLEVLTRKVPVAETDEEKISIYTKMAYIWENHFEQLEMAIGYYEKILKIDEGHIPSILELERIYEHMGDWGKLVDTYKRHIAQIADIDEIVKLYCKIGRICSEYLFNPGDAITYLNKALSIDPENVEVLEALSDLYLTNEKWKLAIEILEKMVELEQDKEKKTSYIIKIAQIYKEELEDTDSAERHLRALFEEDISYVPAIRALRRFYQEAKRWDDFLAMVEHEKEYVSEPADIAQLLYEESLFYRREKGDSQKAIELLTEALEHKPDFGDAVKELAAITYSMEMWEDAWNYLTESLKFYDPESEEENRTLALVHYQLGRVAEQLGKDDLALKHYGESYRRYADSLDTLEALANVLYRREDWEQAFRVYQTILVRFRDKKSTDELVSLFCRLGEINGKMGKHDVAVRMYEKALEIDPESVEALTASVGYYESLKRWPKVIKYRVALAKLLPKDGAFEQWQAIGDIYADELEQMREALEAYKRALLIHNDHLPLITKVAQILEKQGKWNDAIAAYRRILALEKDREKKVELTIKIADMLREHGDEPELCVDFYNAALDLDPHNSEAFAKLEKFLYENEMWDELDNSYRLQLARMPDEDVKEKVALWKKLADVLVNKKHNIEDGLKVYEVIVSLEPDVIEHKIALANMYSRDPQYYDRAVAIHESLLSQDILNKESHQVLFELNFNLERFDRAFLHTAVLDVLGGGDEKAREFFAEHSREQRTEPIDFLDRNEWFGYVLHPAAQNMAGQIMAIIYHHVGAIIPSDLKSLGVRKRDKLELSESITFCLTTNQVLRTLSAPAPDIYMREGLDEEILIAPVYPPAMLIPTNAFENYPTRDLLFHVGRAVTLARPDFALATMYSPNDLREIFEAAISIYVPDYPIESDPEKVAELRKRIEKGVPRKTRPQLEQFVIDFVEKSADEFDFNQWFSSLFFSANRAAMIVCNDLPTALKWVERYAEGEGRAWIDAQRKDLINYWISEEYWFVRRKLGFSIV